MNGLLPADHPGVQRVFYELQRLLLNIRKARLFQVTHHVGRHSENSRDLIDLEFSRLQKLRLLRRDADGRVLHALLQHGDLVAVAAAAEGGLPALPHPLGVFYGAGMFQHTAGGRAIGEELSPVLLAGNRHTDGVLGHGNGTVSHQPIKAQTGDVQHIRGRQVDGNALHGGSILCAGGVLVVEPTFGVPVHHHAVWHQRIESNHFTFSVADNLCISIAPQQKMGHERLPEHEGTHLRVWFVMQEQIQRMVNGFLLASVLLIVVKVQRKTCHCFRQDADAGIHRRHLHGRPFIDPFARSTSSKEKAVGAACSAVLGLIPGTEKPGKNTHIESPSFQINKRPRLS